MIGRIKIFLIHDKRLGTASSPRRYDLPLDADAGTRFLIVLTALMTFLAVLSLAASFSLSALGARWSTGLENKVTIEIPAEKADATLRSRDSITNLGAAVEKKLKTIPYIKTAQAMSEAEVRELIAPWLGAAGAEDDIPLPGLVSVELQITTPDITEKLQSEMAALDPGIRVDTHESWLGSLLKLTGALRFATAMIALVIGAITVIAISGAVRTRMALHEKEVSLLHLMGASDEYIASQLQRHALIVCAKGSLAGLLAAMAALVVIYVLAGPMAANLVPDFSLGLLHIIGFLCVPALACGIAALSARFTVLRTLAGMP